MLKLDIRTLSVLATLSSLLLLLGLQLVRRTNVTNPSLRLWTMGAGINCVGYVLLALRGTVSDMLSIVIANSLLVPGFACLYGGHRRFEGEENDSSWYWLLTAATAALFYYFTYPVPSLTARIVVISAATAAALFPSALVLLRTGDSRDRVVRWFLATAYLMTALFCSVRAIATPFVDSPEQEFMAVTSLVQTLALVFVTGLNVALGIGLPLLILGRTQRQLLTSEDRYRTLVEWSPEPLAVHCGGKLIYVNPAAIKMIGANSAQDVLGKAILDLVHPDFRDLVRARAQTATEQHTSLPLLEEKFVKLDGTIIDVEVQSISIDYDGKPAVQVAMRDITERRQAEKAIRESERRFRGLIEQSLTGVYVSQDSVLVYANPRLEQILGYGPGELLGLRIDDIVLAEDLPILQGVREKLSAGATSISYEGRARRKDGSVIEMGVQGSRSEFNGAPATIGMAQDITEKKRAEDEIKRYITQLQTAFMSTVKVATTLGELRDPYTAGHERRVAEVAAAIGAELGLSEQQQEGLRVAGYLHDIGKITVPSEILSKPGKLSPIEYNLIQGHAQASHVVLKDVGFPWPVAEVALQHHERMDGSGYPQGLKGDAILLEARIMAVADVVEAMSSHRPYRPGLGMEKALAEIERGRGTAYDAAVADACLRLFRDKGYTISA